MLIKSEFDIQFHLPLATTMIAMLDLHPSLDGIVRHTDHLKVEHVDLELTTELTAEHFVDSFGNRCARFHAPQGALRLSGSNLVDADEMPDPIFTEAVQHPIEELPTEVLPYLLSSRYCQVDTMSSIANDLFSHTTPGWARAINIRDWVHSHVQFNYMAARSTKTALDVYTERVGVCRDFQHLAITLCRAMNLPARYVTGYIGDIRMPSSGAGDFSAWYEIYLSGRWWPMDARHNYPRLGRLLMATGRDATDVAITTSFGIADLKHFFVESYEIDENGTPRPLPPGPNALASRQGNEQVVPNPNGQASQNITEAA